jgi:hypothetical protein
VAEGQRIYKNKFTLTVNSTCPLYQNAFEYPYKFVENVNVSQFIIREKQGILG